MLTVDNQEQTSTSVPKKINEGFIDTDDKFKTPGRTTISTTVSLAEINQSPEGQDKPEHKDAFQKRNDYVSPNIWTLKVNDKYCAHKVNVKDEDKSTLRDSAANKRVNAVFDKIDQYKSNWDANRSSYRRMVRSEKNIGSDGVTNLFVSSNLKKFETCAQANRTSVGVPTQQLAHSSTLFIDQKSQLVPEWASKIERLDTLKTDKQPNVGSGVFYSSTLQNLGSSRRDKLTSLGYRTNFKVSDGLYKN